MRAELLSHVEESWWHETIRLYVAQGDGTAIIEKCLENWRIRFANSISCLILALECEKEAATVRPDVREQVRRLIAEGIESEDDYLRTMAAQALLNRRFGNLRRESDDLEVDTTLITHAEYQLFLDQKRVTGEYLQPDHWLDYKFPKGQGPKAGGWRALQRCASLLRVANRTATRWLAISLTATRGIIHP